MLPSWIRFPIPHSEEERSNSDVCGTRLKTEVHRTLYVRVHEGGLAAGHLKTHPCILRRILHYNALHSSFPNHHTLCYAAMCSIHNCRQVELDQLAQWTILLCWLL